MQDILQELKTIPKQGIYLLENSNNKSCYIGYSSNIPLALIRYLDNNIISSELIFETLEIVTSKDLLRPRCQFYKDHYSNIGYKLLNPSKVCNLKLRIELLNDFRHVANGTPIVYVNLVSRGYRKITVGVFETITEAEIFVAEKYSNNNIYDFIYSDNLLTRQYLGRK